MSDELPSGLPMTWSRLRMSYPHRRRFALRKGRRLPCPSVKMSKKSEEKDRYWEWIKYTNTGPV